MQILLTIQNNREFCEHLPKHTRVVDGVKQYAYEFFFEQSSLESLSRFLEIDLNINGGEIDGRRLLNAIKANADNPQLNNVHRRFLELVEKIAMVAERREEPVVWGIYNDHAIDA